MIYLILAVAVCISVLTACVGWVVNDIPLLGLIGLVLSSFTFGFIMGENHGHT